MRETFTSFKDFETNATCVNVNVPSLTACAYTRVGMFTLTLIAIISRSLKLTNVSLIEYFIYATVKPAVTTDFFKQMKDILYMFYLALN